MWEDEKKTSIAWCIPLSQDSDTVIHLSSELITYCSQDVWILLPPFLFREAFIEENNVDPFNQSVTIAGAGYTGRGLPSYWKPELQGTRGRHMSVYRYSPGEKCKRDEDLWPWSFGYSQVRDAKQSGTTVAGPMVVPRVFKTAITYSSVAVWEILQPCGTRRHTRSCCHVITVRRKGNLEPAVLRNNDR